MKHATTTTLPLHTLDNAMYAPRSNIESIRTAAIRELWQALRSAISHASQHGSTCAQPTAASC